MNVHKDARPHVCFLTNTVYTKHTEIDFAYMSETITIQVLQHSTLCVCYNIHRVSVFYTEAHSWMDAFGSFIEITKQTHKLTHSWVAYYKPCIMLANELGRAHVCVPMCVLCIHSNETIFFYFGHITTKQAPNKNQSSSRICCFYRVRCLSSTSKWMWIVRKINKQGGGNSLWFKEIYVFFYFVVIVPFEFELWNGGDRPEGWEGWRRPQWNL